jgi:hypothetical protein
MLDESGSSLLAPHFTRVRRRQNHPSMASVLKLSCISNAIGESYERSMDYSRHPDRPKGGPHQPS